MISELDNRGKVRFMLYKETMTAKFLLRFFKRLITDAKRKVFVILDNLRVHHAKIIRQWVSKHSHETPHTACGAGSGSWASFTG